MKEPRTVFQKKYVTSAKGFVTKEQILSRSILFPKQVSALVLLKLDRPRLKRGVGELLFTQLKRALCQIVLKLRALILQSPEPL